MQQKGTKITQRRRIKTHQKKTCICEIYHDICVQKLRHTVNQSASQLFHQVLKSRTKQA